MSAIVDNRSEEPTTPHRVLIVDDHPELRALLRLRLEFEPDIDVVGEASNGVEAVRLTTLLSPSAVVIDLEMPLMNGADAIPLLRRVAPGMGIVLYTSANGFTLDEEQVPDAVVDKGVSLEAVVLELRGVLEQAPFDILRLELGSVPLQDAISAFDSWIGLNMRVLDAIHRDDELTGSQLSGTSRPELAALMGIYAHLGYNLQKAARSRSDHVDLVVHVLRENGVLARRALLAFNDHRIQEFWAAWGYDVPDAALRSLGLVRDLLMEVLPASTGADEATTAASPPRPALNRDAAGSDRDDAAAERGRLADERDHYGEHRDRAMDDRDDVLAKRDRSSEARDGAGDVRDIAGLDRDDAGAKRDEVAEQRDRAAEVIEARHGPRSVEVARQAALGRRAAAADRLDALEDRRAGADERLDAEQDRGAALSDRLAGARHRTIAGVDRDASSTDRHAGATERTQADLDRAEAHLDRIAAARERDDASVDTLTGVARRDAGFLALDREIARVRRTGESLVVGFLDVDGLKAVNDRHGHLAGDEMLQTVAEALRANLRDADLIFRYGGDEFVCSLAAVDAAFSEARLARINAALADRPVPASVTAGFVELLQDETSTDVLARADAALYAKRGESPTAP